MPDPGKLNAQLETIKHLDLDALAERVSCPFDSLYGSCQQAMAILSDPSCVAQALQAAMGPARATSLLRLRYELNRENQ